MAHDSPWDNSANLHDDSLSGGPRGERLSPELPTELIRPENQRESAHSVFRWSIFRKPWAPMKVLPHIPIQKPFSHSQRQRYLNAEYVDAYPPRRGPPPFPPLPRRCVGLITPPKGSSSFITVSLPSARNTGGLFRPLDSLPMRRLRQVQHLL